MEHEVYYAGIHVHIATYFHIEEVKTNSSGQTVLDFSFPSLNCDERKLQGLFNLTFKLMDKQNSKKTEDWVLISNIMEYPVEIV